MPSLSKRDFSKGHKYVYLADLDFVLKKKLVISMKKSKKGRAKLNKIREAKELFKDFMEGSSFRITDYEYKEFTGDK